MPNIDTDDFWEDFKTRREEVTSQTIERDARYGYRVVSSDSLWTLENQVLDLLKVGWRPTGGMSIQSRRYFQTMYKV